jgi:FkbM family methyltransferase
MKNKIKRLIKSIFELTGYSLVSLELIKKQQRQPQLTKENFLQLFFSSANPTDFFFVQIGAADGKVNDPIYDYVTHYNLKGLVVEPQRLSYQRLQDNYKGYPVTCVQAAISETSGKCTLWSIKESVDLYGRNSILMAQKTSFSKEILKKTIQKKLPTGANAERYIEPIEVPSLSFVDLIREYDVKRIDMLQIDAEGYDYEIIKSFDFSRISPKVLNFESNRLSVQETIECEEFLENNGYSFFILA